MPLSKERQRQWMRDYRQRKESVIPNLDNVIPKLEGVLDGVIPDSEGYYPAWAITSWRKFNGKVRQPTLPNCL